MTENIIIRPDSDISLYLGKQGEDLVVVGYEFDCSQFAALYGDGHAEVVHCPAGASHAYPVALIRDGNSYTWNVTSADTASAGQGVAELRWYVNGSGLAKSMLMDTTVRPAIVEVGDTPDPIAEWIEEASRHLAAIEGIEDLWSIKQDAAQSMNLARESAERAGVYSNAAYEDAEKARRNAETSELNKLDSKGYAEEASRRAADAKKYADDANEASKSSEHYAYEAQLYMGSADRADENARENAKKAEASQKRADEAAGEAYAFRDGAENWANSAKAEADRAQGEADRAKALVDGAESAIEAKTNEQLARIPEVEQLAQDVAKKLERITLVHDGNWYYLNGKRLSYSDVLALCQNPSYHVVMSIDGRLCEVDYANDYAIGFVDLSGMWMYHETYYQDGHIDFEMTELANQRDVDNLYREQTAEKEKIQQFEERLDNVDQVIIETVEPLQKQADETRRDLDMLYKVSKGQLWDIEQREEEGHAQLPSGGEFGNVDEVRGKTEQESTNGYQMLKPRMHKQTINGITFETDNASIYRIFGTAEQVNCYGSYGEVDTLYLEPGTYTLSMTSGLPDHVYFQIIASKNGSTGWSSSLIGLNVLTNYETKTVTLTESCYAKWRPSIQGATIGDTFDFTMKCMLEKGSTAHPYEPYTGGIPSPNPSFPEEIKSVDSIEVRKEGKNLFNGREHLMISSNNTFVEGSGYISSIIPMKAGQSVILSGQLDGLNSEMYRCAFSTEYPAVGVSYTRISGNVVIGLAPYKATEDGYFTAMMSFKAGHTADEVNAQAEYGTVATTYEPYQEPIVRTITPPRPLNKIGDYADLCDVVGGVWRYENGDRTLDENSGWIMERLSAGRNFYCSRNGLAPNQRGANVYAISHGRSSSYLTTRGDSYISAGNINFLWAYDISLDEFIEWVKMNNIRIVARLENPTTEPISAEDLDFLRNLTLNEGENLFITDNHGRDVSYLMSDFINLGKVGG